MYFDALHLNSTISEVSYHTYVINAKVRRYLCMYVIKFITIYEVCQVKIDDTLDKHVMFR